MKTSVYKATNAQKQSGQRRSGVKVAPVRHGEPTKTFGGSKKPSR